MEKEGSATAIPKPILEAAKQVEERKPGKIKSAFRALANADEALKETVCSQMVAWLSDRIKPDMFVRLAKHFYKFFRACPGSAQKSLPSRCETLCFGA